MDSLSNSTTPSTPQLLSLGFIIWYGVASGIVFFIGMVSNAISIYMVSKTATLQTTTNIHLIGLCIADCIHLASSPILVTVMALENFVFSDFTCKTFMLAQGVNWFAGTFLLSSMSVHRYLSVRFPISLRIIHGKRCALITVTCLWILAFLLLSPLAVFSVRIETKTNLQNKSLRGVEGTRGACVINWSTGKPAEWWEKNLSRVFTAYTFVLGFLLPVLVNSVVYSLLIHHLRSKRRRLCQDASRSAASWSFPASQIEPLSEVDQAPPFELREAKDAKPRTQSSSRKSAYSGKRLSWKVASLVLIYVILWLPYWVQQVLIAFSGSFMSFSSARVAFMTQLLGYANSAINPIIYTCLSTPFRKNILRLFKKSCGCGLWIKSSREDHSSFVNHMENEQHECFADGCPYLCKCFY